jgi:hypothetical protein
VNATRCARQRAQRALFAVALAVLIATGLSGPAAAAVDKVELQGAAAAHEIGVHGRKAPPPAIGLPPHDVSLAGAPHFFYAGAYDFGTAAGASALMTIRRPTVAAADDHSLAELAVQSADQRQAIEVGWTVDPKQFGDSEPHLFVFHWVDGVRTCYNGCGFVPFGQARVGMILPVDATQLWPFTIRHDPGSWSIYFGLSAVGYFPDSLWGGRFTQIGLVQAFGEVSASSTTPCTDMGSGAFPTANSGARISSIRFLGAQPGSAVPAVDITTNVTHPNYYKAIKTGAGSIRYGGPGAC